MLFLGFTVSLCKVSSKLVKRFRSEIVKNCQAFAFGLSPFLMLLIKPKSTHSQTITKTCNLSNNSSLIHMTHTCKENSANYKVSPF